MICIYCKKSFDLGYESPRKHCRDRQCAHMDAYEWKVKMRKEEKAGASAEKANAALRWGNAWREPNGK
jgi:hypothetical protein